MRTATSSALLDQVDRPVDERQRHRHVGEAIQELEHDRRHVQPPEQDRRGDAQLAARRGALPRGGPFDLVEIGEHAPRARQEPLASLGHVDRAGGAVEQPHPEPRFELADGARDRGRRPAEPPRRLSKTAPLGDLDEGRNAADPIHIVAIIAIISCEKQALSSLTKLPF